MENGPCENIFNCFRLNNLHQKHTTDNNYHPMKKIRKINDIHMPKHDSILIKIKKEPEKPKESLPIINETPVNQVFQPQSQPSYPIPMHSMILCDSDKEIEFHIKMVLKYAIRKVKYPTRKTATGRIDCTCEIPYPYSYDVNDRLTIRACIKCEKAKAYFTFAGLYHSVSIKLRRKRNNKTYLSLPGATWKIFDNTFSSQAIKARMVYCISDFKKKARAFKTVARKTTDEHTKNILLKKSDFFEQMSNDNTTIYGDNDRLAMSVIEISNCKKDDNQHQEKASKFIKYSNYWGDLLTQEEEKTITGVDNHEILGDHLEDL